MSEKHSSNGRAVQAACLYRNSDDKQENSVERQRDGVEPYARRKGYETVAEYVFDGIPGDEISRHPDWKRLLRDAEAGSWSVLVVDEPSRLSREDPIDFIVKVVDPFRKAGVRVDTVSAGPLDYESLAGIILSVVHADKASAEPRHLSRRTLGGMIHLAKEGLWFGWICPYGLRVERIIDPMTGKILERKCVLGPEEEVRVVRFIFDTVANRGWSLRRICRELEARGVKPPVGNGRGKNKAEGRWNPGTIRKWLVNRKYIGDFSWNETHQGKYSSWKGGNDGRVEQNGTINRRTSRNGVEDWIIVPDLIPPLIDRDTFIRAGLALAQAQKRTTANGDTARYLFTHMLVCGDCGSFLRGQPCRGGKGYICAKYKEYGSGACSRNMVLEKPLLDAILDKTLGVILDPARLDAIEAEMVRRLEAERASGGAERIRQQIAALERDIAQGNANLARLPEDRLAGVVACVRQWEIERDGLEARLRELATGEGQQKAILAEARKQLWRLREALLGDDKELQAAVVREVISKAQVRFAHEETHGRRSPTGKRRRLSRATGALLYVRPGLDLSCLFTSDCQNPVRDGASGRASSCRLMCAAPG
jgi:site-specific DNA recombinase